MGRDPQVLEGREVTGLSAIEKTVTGLDYELVDCERAPRGLLRVFIDRPDGTPVTVDDCEAVTRQLQYVLEVEGVDYQRLEVSSPGLDRPLKRPSDWQRFAGSEIELTLKLPFQGRKKYRGRLQAGSGEGWQVVFDDGKGARVLDFGLAEVREARLVPMVDFKRRAAVPVKVQEDGSRDQ